MYSKLSQQFSCDLTKNMINIVLNFSSWFIFKAVFSWNYVTRAIALSVVFDLTQNTKHKYKGNWELLLRSTQCIN